MKRREFIKYTSLAVPLFYSGRLLSSLDTSQPSAGRLGFYVDYSELSSLGQHTFYVTRTNGFAGQVQVDYSTHGDLHDNVRGTLSWDDGDFDVKSFTVNIPSKSDGEHRIYAQLTNPTGGAQLHNGNYTRAYGVIDDDTISSNEDAVFYDSDAPNGGNGSISRPFNDIYIAIANIGAKRYLYGKGITVPSSTNSVNPNGGGGFVNCILLPEGRTDESDRLYIRNWPGFGWKITGNKSANSIGFYSDGGVNYNPSNYITFKGIDFEGLDSSGSAFAEGGGINFFRKGGTAINVEYCNFTNINGATNTSGFNAYAVDGAKVWRCSANKIMVNGDANNQNGAGLCVFYNATNLSFQRCEISDSAIGLNFKRPSDNNVSPVVRFCKFLNTGIAINFGFGSNSHEANYTCIQSNLFKNCLRFMAIQITGADPEAAGHNQISNNVFDNCGLGDNGAIQIKDAYEFMIFNNVFLNCRKMWDVPEELARQSNQTRNVLLFADFNHDYGTSLVRYELLSKTYGTSSLLNQANPHLAANDSTGDPLFTSPEQGDYTYQLGSPCIESGYKSKNKGIYLTNTERLGLSDSLDLKLPPCIKIDVP